MFRVFIISKKFESFGDLAEKREGPGNDEQSLVTHRPLFLMQLCSKKSVQYFIMKDGC